MDCLYCWVGGILYRYRCLIRYMTCKSFLPFCGLSFHLLDDFLWSTKVLHFDEVQFTTIYFVACAFGVLSKIPLSDPKSWRLTPVFSSRGFIALALTNYVFDAFWISFIWCEVIEKLLHVAIQWSQHHLLKKTILHKWFWYPCQKSLD